jgi:TonB family protein
MRVAELPPEIRLHQSSGDEALDRSALEMMEQAVKTARIPLELQGRRFRIAVPVEYRLAD